MNHLINYGFVSSLFSIHLSIQGTNNLLLNFVQIRANIKIRIRQINNMSHFTDEKQSFLTKQARFMSENRLF